MEVKCDGWRMIASVEESGTRMFSRTGKEYTGKVKAIEAELARAFKPGTVLDGEILTFDHDCSSVSKVFGRSSSTPAQEVVDSLHYVAFDVVDLGGHEVSHLPLADRRRVLTEAYDLANIDPTLSVYIRQHPASEEQYTSFVKGGFEGAMIKDASLSYAKGKRGHGWFKIKASTTIDTVVTELPVDGKGQYQGQVGRMVVSQYQDGELVERAKVNPPSQEERLEMTNNPDKYLGRVVEVKHYGVLKDGLRHPTFVRWREDKEAGDCTFHN
jgi:bifunctional non-homologous end joining protein LigD